MGGVMSQREWYEQILTLPCPCCRAPGFGRPIESYTLGQTLLVNCLNPECGFFTTVLHWQQLQNHITLPRRMVRDDIHLPRPDGVIH